MCIILDFIFQLTLICESYVKMQIKLICNENGEEEWMMIEMQGSFEIESDISGKTIGYFAWREDSSACFIIGHQLFEGKLIELERPFLVINKSLLRNQGKNNINTDENDVTVRECDIVGVIWRKIIFKERPKPIVTHKTINA